MSSKQAEAKVENMELRASVICGACCRVFQIADRPACESNILCPHCKKINTIPGIYS